MMRHIIRDLLRSVLVIMLITSTALITGLGVTVHLFTRQQTKAVDDSAITLAVRHLYSGEGFVRDSAILENLNKHPSVKVPALIKSYWGIDTSVTPVYSENVEGTYYNWSRDDELARTVMSVTCIEDLGKDPYVDCWYAIVRVDEVHLPLPFDIPEEIKVIGYTRGVVTKQSPLVPGESYLLCGRYDDYIEQEDFSASFSGGQYKTVYRKDRSQPPTLSLTGWNDSAKWMKYIATPADTIWLEEAISIGGMLNHSMRLDCINDLNRLRWFTNGNAIIVEGRSFTEEEQTHGAKVCLISQELANANGLKVGDTISMTAYASMISIKKHREQDHLDMMYETLDVRTAQGEPVTFEIVGIYSAPLYTNTIDEFVPNTVIAPYNSMQLDSGRRTVLPIQTQNLILHNGQGEAFLQAVRDAGYPEGFYTIEETNYEAIKDVLASMSADSVTLLAISVSVGVVMLIVVLALYARGWRKENAILAMLGTTQARIGWRMFGSLTVLILLGSVAAFGGMCATKSYIEAALNSVYIGKSADFSAIRVGAFSAEGMTIGVEVIAVAMLMTAGAFLLIAAVQSVISARKKVRECLFD